MRSKKRQQMQLSRNTAIQSAEKMKKNSKGIYYTNGNYEAFARPKKPQGLTKKSAYIVRSGLASLAAACFLVKRWTDAGRSHSYFGGNGHCRWSMWWHLWCDQRLCNAWRTWDGKSFWMSVGFIPSIPSIETPGVSVLDEYYWLNKRRSKLLSCRATEKQGKDAHTDGKFNLSQKGCMEIMKLSWQKTRIFTIRPSKMYLMMKYLTLHFWLYWRTMFAFENWHSALEMKLYFQRFIHHIAGLPDFSTEIYKIQSVWITDSSNAEVSRRSRCWLPV